MKIDIKKLTEFLDNKNFEEAKKLLEEFAKSPMTEEEEGGVLTGAIIKHIDTMTAIQEQYIDLMKGLLDDLKTIEKKESEIDDMDKINKVRDQLAKS